MNEQCWPFLRVEKSDGCIDRVFACTWCAFTYGDGGKGEKEQGGVDGGTHVCQFTSSCATHSPVRAPASFARHWNSTSTILRLQATGDVHTWVPSPGVAPGRVETLLNYLREGNPDGLWSSQCRMMIRIFLWRCFQGERTIFERESGKRR